MSNRSLIEINHEFCPKGDDESLLAWARRVRRYVTSGERQDLPDGMTLKWSRHHSDPCPFDQPLAFERRFPRSRC
jgi:hypothetical protein